MVFGQQNVTLSRSPLGESFTRSVLGNPHGAMHFPTHLILDLWRHADLALRLLGANLVTLLVGPFWITVAVGTTIADRPPHRSVRARLRIRLLPRMNGVEALVRIRMQNMRVRNPPVQQWVETIPSHLRALTATD